MDVEFIEDGDVMKFVKDLRRLLREDAHVRDELVSALEVAAVQSEHVGIESPDVLDVREGWNWGKGAYTHSCAAQFQTDTGQRADTSEEAYTEWLLSILEHDLIDPESYRGSLGDEEVLAHVAAYVYAAQYVRHMVKIVERKGRRITPEGQRSMFDRSVQKVLRYAEWVDDWSKAEVLKLSHAGEFPLRSAKV